MDPIRAATCSALNVLVAVKLPEAHINARLVRSIGEDTIMVTFTHRKEWVNKIIENDKFFHKLLVQHDEKGWYCEGPIVPKHAMKLAGAVKKWRKISGKTEDEVMTKLTQWFLDNADIFV